MLTSFGDDEALFDAIMAGAAGYMLKQIRGLDLVRAVRTLVGWRVDAGPDGGRPANGQAAGQASRSTIRWQD